MASDMLTIAASGAAAARGALNITAQNIANASTEGYVRRSANMQEVSSSGGPFRANDMSLSGVRIGGINRNVDPFRQAEVRRTNSDITRANAELGGLENIESAVENAGIYDAIVEFEASLQQLQANPTDSSLRAATMASAETLANKFNIAANSLDAVGDGLRFDANAAVGDANIIGGELARVNLQLARAGQGSSDRATLLDQRDNLLERLSGFANISTSFGPDGAATVTIGNFGGTPFVTGGNAATLAMTTAADGTIGFTQDGAAVTLAGGALSGGALALQQVATVRTRLDTMADDIAGAINTAQSNGAALDGTAGQPLFTGSGAAGMALTTMDGAAIATAPAGSPAGSRDASNLIALRQSLESGGAASGMNSLIFDISSQVSGRQITADALGAIATSARISLEQQSGVDLDTEATNLIRFQQAFQASGRAMQVASDIFDTMIGIGR